MQRSLRHSCWETHGQTAAVVLQAANLHLEQRISDAAQEAAAATAEAAAMADLEKLISAAPEESAAIASAAVAAERSRQEARNAGVLALLHSKASLPVADRLPFDAILLDTSSAEVTACECGSYARPPTAATVHWSHCR